MPTAWGSENTGFPLQQRPPGKRAMSPSPDSGNEDGYVSHTLHYVVLALHCALGEAMCGAWARKFIVARLRRVICYLVNAWAGTERTTTLTYGQRDRDDHSG